MPIETEHDTELIANETQPALENLTLWQRVHTHLREEILSGELPAGSELQEVALSKTLGVSRGPIREAIGRLAAEGLVTVRPRRGAVVRALSSDEFIEAYQVREALETMAVRLAVPKLTADDLAALERDDRRDVRLRRFRRRAGLLRGEHRFPPRFLRRGRQPDAARTSTVICRARSTGTGSARSSCVAT